MLLSLMISLNSLQICSFMLKKGLAESDLICLILDSQHSLAK